MATTLRMIEMLLRADLAPKAKGLLEEREIPEHWQQDLPDEQVMFRFLIPAEEAEALQDVMVEQFSATPGFRIIVYPVEATIPRFETPEAEADSTAGEQEEQNKAGIARVSREELYEDVAGSASPSRNFIILVILSAIVAGIGFMQNNIAIIIGAMVIAPLLGPNIALTLGTTLGDFELVKKSMLTAIAGTVIVLVISVVWGVFDPSVGKAMQLTDIGYSNVVLALVSGIAAVLSVLGGVSAALVGVMVAIALLPPLVKTGLLLGAGQWLPAFYAFLIFAVNIICLNLAGIITFLAAGIRPNTWWETKKARKQTKTAIIFWSVLLALLVLILFFVQP